jgi:hypothetical protein
MTQATETESSTSGSSSPLKWHTVGVAVLLLLQHPYKYQESSFLVVWFAGLFVVFGVAAVVTLVVWLLSGRGALSKRWKVFAGVSWACAAFALLGQWLS